MFHRLPTTVLLVLLACSPSVAQTLTPAQQYAVSNGALGREFWIAIPPNEIEPYQRSGLEIYVTSPYDTEVRVYDASADRTYKRTLTAGVVRTLNDTRGETRWDWEIREYESVVRKGIRLTADKPFTVSVLNSKVVSSDAYLAIPTVMWDTTYIVTSYYDFNEFKSWAGGFTIVARENGTQVQIDLRGTGEEQATTSGGRTINQGPYTIFMDEGDVYHVKGDGSTRGVFDLTGTKVTSTKPIGVISSHQRTTMPNLLVRGNGRDHLVEMNTPTSQWDTEYVSVEFERNGTNPQAKGDVFRVVAAEPNTRWNLTYYDALTGDVVSQGGGVIATAGGFADLAQSQGPTILTHGVSVWKADKPIQVVQYSCSASFDGDQVHDPFQINLLPSNRYVHATAFQIPTDPDFTEHYLNLVFIADPDDPSLEEHLKAATIDGVAIWNHPNAAVPILLMTNPDGTDVWWARIKFGNEANAHTVLSPHIPFGGYLYGFGQVDSYGLPLGPIHPNIAAEDTVAPVVDATPVVGIIASITVTETTNDPEQVRPQPLPTDQVDAGIAVAGLLEADNMILVTREAPGERRTEATRGVYELRAVDSNLDATGIFYAVDFAGNVTYEEYEFIAPRFPEITAPASANLGETGVDTAICSTDQLILLNTGNDTARITALEILNQPSQFAIEANACPLPILIAPGDSVALDCICFLASASGTYTGRLQITANDQEEPRIVRLIVRVRETIQVSVNEDGVATNDIEITMTESGDVLLSHGTWKPSQWTLFDLDGSMVMTGEIAKEDDVRLFSTDLLVRGLYVLRLDGMNRTSSHKIMVRR